MNQSMQLIFRTNDNWCPCFRDSSGMDINLGSDVKPVLGTVMDYAKAVNRPSINGVELIGDKSNEDLNICPMTNKDIENILNLFV